MTTSQLLLKQPLMTNLSPAAQAVLDAFAADDYGVWLESDPDRLAAALQAAADQVVPDEPHPDLSQFWDNEANREWQNNQHFRNQLLAIATELEALDD